MTVETIKNFDREYITQFSKQNQEPAWLLELRLQSLDQIQELELPKLEKTKIDKWNLLNFTHVVENEKISSVESLPEVVRGFLSQEENASTLLIHKDSTAIYQSVNAELESKGVIFTDIKTALVKHGELLSKYMNKIVTGTEHKVSALHTALFNSGVFLYIPKNVEVDIPIQSLFWQANGNAGLFPHILIVAEDNSKVTYVENSFSSASEESVHNYVAEVFVGKGAKVTFAAVDNLGTQTTSYIYRRSKVDQDARIEWALGQMNNGNTVSDNTTILSGNGSTGDTKSVVIGTGEQSLNFVQKMHQFGHYTDGEMLSHGVMKDSARAIFNGITKIEKGAVKSTGEQSERVLMLNEKARGDANPILLIDENVERAGHAASVGNVNPNQLFYLMARGLTRAEAERLIILGFLAPVIENIPIEELKQRLVEVIERKISS